MVEDAGDPARASLDAAIERTLGAPELTGVYLSPWWPLGPSGSAGPPAGWKRSILQRVPGRGAVHWGHLYLLVHREARLAEPAGMSAGSGTPSGPPIEIELPAALKGERSLWVRPRLLGPCEVFARRLGSELARPVPETS